MTPTPASIAPVVVAPVSAPAVTAPPSGLKTTELWIAMFLLGVLTYAGQQLITLLPTILANPAMPPWIAPVAPIALVGLAWVMRLVAAEYTKSRTALKLDANSPDVSAAIAAGKTAGGADLAAQLKQINS